jgi:hypothetical protein
MATYPGSEKARLQQFLFPGVQGRLEVLHLHASASCEQKSHNVPSAYQLIATAWRVLRLRIAEIASRYRGQLRIH